MCREQPIVSRYQALVDSSLPFTAKLCLKDLTSKGSRTLSLAVIVPYKTPQDYVSVLLPQIWAGK